MSSLYTCIIFVTRGNIFIKLIVYFHKGKAQIGTIYDTTIESFQFYKF
jgi:hypothetical protein